MRARKDNRFEPLDDVENVASLTECTGLVPALPRDEAEDASAAALYAIHRPKPADTKFPTK